MVNTGVHTRVRCTALFAVLCFAAMPILAACFKPAKVDSSGPSGDVDTIVADSAAETTAADTPGGDSAVGTACRGDGECAAFDGPCAAGHCESGACVARLVDGACDDGDPCTTGDACQEGACRGEAVVCEALDDCHLAGVCDPQSGACTSPVRDDDSACDDDDVCTGGDRCSAGICRGPQTPETDDFTVGFESDGEVSIGAVAVDLQRKTYFALGFQGKDLTAVGSIATTIVPTDRATVRCQVLLGVLRSNGTLERATLFAEPTCISYVSVVVVGVHPLGDGTQVILGAYSRPFVTIDGHEVGQSPTGLLLDGGHFLMRVDAEGAVLWSVELLGFGKSFDGLGLAQLAVRGANTIAVGVNFGEAEGMRQVIASDGTVWFEESVSGEGGALLLVVSPSGVILRGTRIDWMPTEPPSGMRGGLVLRGLSSADDGTLFASGFTTAGDTRVGANAVTVVPTGLYETEAGWVVALDSDGEVSWWSHVFAPASQGIDDRELATWGQAIGAGEGQVWASFYSSRHLRARGAPGAGVAVTQAEGPHPGTVTLVGYDSRDGRVVGGEALGVAETESGALLVDDFGTVIAGETLGFAASDELVQVPDVRRPFVARVGRWARQLVRASPQDQGEVGIGRGGGFIAPRLVSDRRGGFVLAGMVTAPVDVGLKNPVRVTPRGEGPAAYITRQGSGHWLDCN